jgi:TolB-like protein
MAAGGGEAEAAGAHAGTADVFVSYASQDAAVAHEAVEILERQAIGCWIAPRNVIAGAHYADAIITAITGARALVLVLSDAAMTSKHVGKEIERASSKGRSIIALRMSVAPLPPAFEYFLSESQWIEVGAGGVAGVASKLTEAVRTHLQPSSATSVPQVRSGPPVASPPAAARRRSWLLAGGAVLLILTLAYVAMGRLQSAKPLIEHGPGAAVNAVADHAPVSSDKSVAVLPFVDMSEQHDQDYFSDGLSEELIDHLAHIPDLRVIARTSAFAFKGKNEDVRSIATKLGVTNVLEGSVRKVGSKLRIAAQLIRASDGAHVWSDTYNRNLSDIFKLQDEISTTVANALNVALNVNDAARAKPVSRGTTNIDAYKLMLQGTFYFWRGDAGDNQRAIDLFRQSLALDPHYALAWAKLGRAYAWEGFSAELPAEAAANGRDAVQRALAIDPNCAEAYYARGNIARLVDGITAPQNPTTNEARRWMATARSVKMPEVTCSFCRRSRADSSVIISPGRIDYWSAIHWTRI